MKNLLATCALVALAAPAGATPFTLFYDVAQSGTGWAYDFNLVLDNNDGSWSSGQAFDRFIIGDDPTASPFTERQ